MPIDKEFKKFDKFLSETILELKKHDCSVKFLNSDQINEYCFGLFTPGEIRIAKNHSDWRYGFVHEYCHFLQYQSKEGRDLFEEYQTNYIAHDEYLYYNLYKTFLLDKFFEIKISLEAHCEKMVAKLIKTNENLSELDLEYHICTANMRLLSIHYFEHVWLRFADIIDTSEIRLPSSHFLKSYTVPPKYIQCQFKRALDKWYTPVVRAEQRVSHRPSETFAG